MNFYLYVLVATKGTVTAIQTAQFLVASDERAQAHAQTACMERFPVIHGYHNHQAFANRFEPDMLRELIRLANKALEASQ